MQKTFSPLLQIGLCTIGCLCATSNTASAQVTSDGTVNTQVNQNGNVAEITGGETRGSNLFHSFQDFSVPTGNEAFFDNASDISNIFSRVTGGNISNIDGLIRANGSADLFLINPAGIIFGENARLDIGGSFLGTTATSILFEDGDFSAADLDNPPLLTVNAPIGLSFREEPAPIENSSTASADFIDLNPSVTFDDNLFGLRVPNGKTFALAGGDITADGGGIVAVGGRIELGAVGESGTLGINFEGDNINFDFPDDLVRANVSLINNAGFLVSGSGGGDIAITARNIEILEGSGLFAGIFSGLGSPNAQAGDINLQANNSVTLDDGNITNDVNFDAIGNSGEIEINTGSLTATNSSQITSQVDGTGNSGDININAQGKVSFDGRDETDSFPSAIFTSVEPSGEGNGGDINIKAKSLELTNRAQLLSNLEGVGLAGDINIQVANEFNLVNSDLISEISAPDENGEGGRGSGGDINIQAGSVLLKDGSSLLADTENIGDAGNITIEASESLVLEGEGQGAFANSTDIVFSQISTTSESSVSGKSGNINISANELSIDEGFVSSSTSSTANAGNVIVSSNNLFLTNGGQITASTDSSGNAGDINLNINDTVLIDGEDKNGFSSGLFASVREDATGQGGNINLGNEQSSIGQLSVTNGAIVRTGTFSSGDAGDLSIAVDNFIVQSSQVSSSTFATGNGGNLTINASESIVVNGELPDSRNGIGSPGGLFAQVGVDAEGQAGDININTNLLSISNGSKVQVANFGQGNAGNLIIRANQIEVFNDPIFSDFTTGIFADLALDPLTENLPEGSAGNIDIGTRTLKIRDGGKITSSTEGIGDAGSIRIKAEDSIEISGVDPEPEDGNSLLGAEVASGATGNGGNIDVKTNEFTIKDQGQILVNSEGSGNAGNLTIIANNIQLINQGQIIAETAFGEGGNITLNIDKNLSLENNSLISAQAFGDANGGNLTIDTNFIIAFPNEIAGNGSDIIANAAEGNGGNISITAESLLGISEGEAIEGNGTNDIDASSEFSLDGTVTINTPDINPVQGATELPNNVVEPEQTTAQACEADRETAAKNGLTINGKGGIPAEPGIPLNSQNVSINGEINPTSAIPAPIETAQGKIQPARGVEITPSGKVILTAYRTNNAGDRIPEKRNCS